jgi:hypothetical protein
MKPEQPKNLRPRAIPAPLVARNLGLSPWASDYAFEYDWPPGAPEWGWLDAIGAADDHQDPTYLLELINKGPPPEQIRSLLKDLFERKFGRPKKGPKRRVRKRSLPRLEPRRLPAPETTTPDRCSAISAARALRASH